MIVPVLAEAGDWLSIWELPIFLVVAGLWIILGGHLIRRLVRPLVGRKEAELNRCLIVALLSGLAGMIAAGIAGALAYLAAKEMNVQTIWLAMPTIAVVFCLVSYLTLFASFQLPAGQVAGIWIKSFGPTLALAVVAGLPSVWMGYRANQDTITRFQSLTHLREIFDKLVRYPASRPPASLNELLKDKLLRPEMLRCRSHPSREIGYFYHPAAPDMEAKRKLLACDWADNQTGGDRAVLFVTGDFKIVTSQEFNTLLAEEQNRAFAEALAQAEKKLLSPG